MVKLTIKQKAAALLVALGPELSAEILKRLGEDVIEELAVEIANLENLPADAIDETINEFYEICKAQAYVSQGGVEYAKEVVEKAMGSNRATEIFSNLSSALSAARFDFLRRTDPAEVVRFVKDEHPQTIALVVVHLPPEQASIVLSQLPPELHAEVIHRIAVMDRITPEVVGEVESILEAKFNSLAKTEEAIAGGVKPVVDILKQVDRATEKSILGFLQKKDPALAEEIKNQLFTFEDIVLLDDAGVQALVQKVNREKLATALKTAEDELKDKVFKNMSERARDQLREDIEYLGPVRLRDVENAQQEVVKAARQLEEEGKIIIARGGGEDIIV
jgi:flagellar motor switch protein FliG